MVLSEKQKQKPTKVQNREYTLKILQDVEETNNWGTRAGQGQDFYHFDF